MDASKRSIVRNVKVGHLHYLLICSRDLFARETSSPSWSGNVKLAVFVK